MNFAQSIFSLFNIKFPGKIRKFLVRSCKSAFTDEISQRKNFPINIIQKHQKIVFQKRLLKYKKIFGPICN